MKTEHFWQVLFALISAIASAYAGYWFGNQADQASIIEYRADSNSNLQKIIGDTDKLKITYGKNDLDALSNTTYLIANTSKKNLDGIKIYFEMEDKSSLPIFHNVRPPKNYPDEAITLISNKNGVYIFELEYLNRTDYIWNGIEFSFYFGGEKPPKASIKTGTKGVSVREYSPEKTGITDLIITMVIKAWWVLLIYIFITYLFLKYFKADKKSRATMFKKSIESELASADGKEQIETVKNILKASKQEAPFKDTLKEMFKSDKDA